eukprot:CAMPEP_0170173784 /NCGR_PEP_ID=MMETSP0040_2-20121228/7051_1 /TAXON_ID=641309 /ORGANISM="Lotharella oceanica, Strain CCMP622" /LENGTH=55 /DNA_ID=CAMNT_0010415133 /DNA_START=687 /DNA_END=850 /DNA_ORIENTATION=-
MRYSTCTPTRSDCERGLFADVADDNDGRATAGDARINARLAVSIKCHQQHRQKDP